MQLKIKMGQKINDIEKIEARRNTSFRFHACVIASSLVIRSSTLVESDLRSNIRCQTYGLSIWQHIVFLIRMK